MRRLLTLIILVQLAASLSAQTWGDIHYDGAPWVDNVSRPYKISEGLYNRHLTVWASHGYYYDIDEGRWQWQRPTLFATNEDLFTQTIVVPYLSYPCSNGLEPLFIRPVNATGSAMRSLSTMTTITAS